MMRHWDFWYTEGKDSHPFYQRIENIDKEYPNLNIIWNNIEKKLKYQQENILINLIDKINSY